MNLLKSKARAFFLSFIPLYIFAHFSHHIMTALITPLLPFMRNEYSLNYTKAGFVVSAFTLSYGLGQLPAGWVADRLSSRTVITIGITGVGLAGALAGLSQNYTILVMCLVLMGLAGGGYHPSAAPLISSSVEKRNQGKALGLHVIGGSASHFLSPLVGVGIASLLGWRGAFLGLSIPVSIFGVVFYILLGKRNKKASHGLKTDVKRQREETEIEALSSNPVKLLA
ncbi:MAG: MFS transporter, partial [Spirochaetota bacterium]